MIYEQYVISYEQYVISYEQYVVSYEHHVSYEQYVNYEHHALVTKLKNMLIMNSGFNNANKCIIFFKLKFD